MSKELRGWSQGRQSLQRLCSDGVFGCCRWLEARGAGEKQVNFKLRDWLFARQRYWGEPFPIIFPEGSDVSDLAPPLDAPQTSRIHSRLEALSATQTQTLKTAWASLHVSLPFAFAFAFADCRNL